MTEERLHKIIETINNKLKGGKKLLLFKEHDKYHLNLKCNNKYNPYKCLTPNGNEHEIYWFLKGMLSTLDIINKK